VEVDVVMLVTVDVDVVVVVVETHVGGIPVRPWHWKDAAWGA